MQNADQSENKSSVKLPTVTGKNGVKTLQLAVGVESPGGVFTKLIPEGTRIPYRLTDLFSTAADNQTIIEVHILAGLHPLAKDNLSLGKFHVAGILPAPRGVPKVDITFRIDAAGVIDISAKDRVTGRLQKFTTNSFQPSKAEIDRLVRDARPAHAKVARQKSFRELIADFFRRLKR